MRLNRQRGARSIILLAISCSAFTRLIRFHSRIFFVQEDGTYSENSIQPVSNATIANTKVKSTLTVVATDTRVHGPAGKNQSICTAFRLADSSLEEVYYLQTSCNDVNIGNKLSRVYMAYAMTRAMNVPFRFICPRHKEKQYQHSILSMLALDSMKHWSKDSTILPAKHTLESLCASCDSQHPHKCPAGEIGLVVQKIRNDLHRIASHDAERRIEKDFDVVLHYRCGDVLGIYAEKYGLLRHSAYAALIRSRHNSSDPFTVAILSNLEETYLPSGATRPRDLPYFQKCQRIVGNLADYLKSQFPNAHVSLPSSLSIAEDYLRILRARSMSICGPSTFCLWPTLASTNPFIYKSSLFPWVEQLDRNVFTVFTAPRLKPKTNQTIDEYGLERIISWLRAG
eukprot:scaffold517_cov119-Cylindrotheca_fusiformis.AAC.2